MQATGSKAASPGWSRRTRIIVGVTALAIFVVWFSYLTVDYIWPGSLSPPSKTRQAEVVAQITGNVTREYGPALAAVHVWYARDGVIPSYFGRYRLRSVPLVFSFSIRDADYWHAEMTGYPPGSPDDIGGLKRFVQLATAFHADFPAQRTMDYMPASSADLTPELQAVADRPGPAVVVFGSGSSNRSLGLYAWSASRGRWELAYRGHVPIRGWE